MPGLGTGSGTVLRIGLIADRPSAEPSLSGYTYFAEDVNSGTWYWCDGSTWVQITSGLQNIVAGANISIISTPTTITISGTATYSLPIASPTVLGGIKVGSNLSIDGSGILSGSAPYTLPIATPTILGGVKEGSNVTIDGTGIISVAAPYSLPIASASVLGGIKVGTGLSIDGGGVLSSSELTDSITFVINGGGTAIATGIVGDLVVPFDCVIDQVTMLADQNTTTIVDIWERAYASFPPTVTQKITASAPPTITSAIKSQDSTLTGWTTAVSAGDVLRFNVNSNNNAQLVTVSLRVVRS